MSSNEFILLGKRISELRAARKFSQERLSELSGISARHISELERGKSNPSYQVLMQMAESLDVPLDVLLDFEHLKADAELQDAIIAIISALPSEKLRLAHRLLFILGE